MRPAPPPNLPAPEKQASNVANAHIDLVSHHRPDFCKRRPFLPSAHRLMLAVVVLVSWMSDALGPSHGQSIATERAVTEEIWADRETFLQLDPALSPCINRNRRLNRAIMDGTDTDARYLWVSAFLRDAPDCIAQRIRERNQPGRSLTPETLAALHDRWRRYNVAQQRMLPHLRLFIADPMEFEFKTYEEDQAVLRDTGNFGWVQWRNLVKSAYAKYYTKPMSAAHFEAFEYADVVAREVDAGNIDAREGRSLLAGMNVIIHLLITYDAGGRSFAYDSIVAPGSKGVRDPTVRGCGGFKATLRYWCTKGIPAEDCERRKRRSPAQCDLQAPTS